MASKAAAKRLAKEAALMEKDPPPFCYARPREDNVLEWHFILRGPPGTSYEGGEYWGQLLFPSDYPFKPPGIKVQTPSGRFAPDQKICTSMSDYHPGSWNPAWSVAGILVGLLSFMCTDEMTAGSVMATNRERQLLAAKSHSFNVAQRRFVQLFPDYAGPDARNVPNMTQAAKPPTPATPVSPAPPAAAPPPPPPSSSWNIGIMATVVLTCLFAAKLFDMWGRA